MLRRSVQREPVIFNEVDSVRRLSERNAFSSVNFRWHVFGTGSFSFDLFSFYVRNDLHFEIQKIEETLYTKVGDKKLDLYRQKYVNSNKITCMHFSSRTQSVPLCFDSINTFLLRNVTVVNVRRELSMAHGLEINRDSTYKPSFNGTFRFRFIMENLARVKKKF